MQHELDNMQSRLAPDQIAGLYALVTEDDALQKMAAQFQRVADVDSVGIWLTERGQITQMVLSDDIVASGPAYVGHFRNLDPWAGSRARYINRTLIGDDLIARHTLLSSEFYNDFGRYYGMVNPIGTMVDVAPQLYASIGLNRTRTCNEFTEGDKPLVAELGLHARQVLRLRRQLADRADAAWQTGAFDAFDFGVVIANRDATLIHANNAARRQARAGAGLAFGLKGSAITAALPSQTGTLKALVASAADGRGGAMRLTGTTGSRLSLLATPLLDVDRTILTRKAMLCLRPETAGAGFNAAMLAQLFGLSPAQTMLCLQLAAGHTFEEAAAARNIAVTTARTHFRAILARTGTTNLRDLLRLLASLPPPLSITPRSASEDGGT